MTLFALEHVPVDTANQDFGGRKINLVVLLVLMICRGEKRTNV